MISASLAAQTSPDTLLQALNVSFADGSVRREGGASLYTAAPVAYPLINAGFDFWPDASTQMEVIYGISGGNAAVLRDAANGAFVVIQGPEAVNSFAPAVFVEGGAESPGRPKKLFLFRSFGATKVLTGNAFTMTTLGGVPLTPPDGQILGHLLLVGEGGGAGGNVDTGVHHYCCTFVTAGGETTPAAFSNPIQVFNSATTGMIQLDFIPFGPPTVTQRKVYRTKAGGTTFFLLVTLNNNTQTEYLDNLADASLPVTQPPVVNTTNGRPLEWADPFNWPSTGAIHARRLWAAGTPNDPHRVYFSTVDDHENLLSLGAGSLSIYPGEGQRIVALLSLASRLIVWKYPTGIYTVDTTSADLAEWRVDRVTRAYGGVNGVTQTMIENDVVFLDNHGEWQLLSAVEQFTNLGGQSLSRATRTDHLFRELAEVSQLHTARLVGYPHRREVHLSFKGKSQFVNNLRLVLDGNTPERPRFRLSDRDVCESLWLRTVNGSPGRSVRLMAGDASGQVWTLDEDATTKQGAGYLSRIQTMWNDVQAPTLDKNAAFLELHFNPVVAATVGVKVYWDSVLATSVTLSLATPAGSHAEIRRVRLTGGGRRFSLEVEQSTAGQDFSLARAFLSYAPRGERVK